jgi:hypothetical protein
MSPVRINSLWQCRQMSYRVRFVHAVGRQNGRQSAGLGNPLHPSQGFSHFALLPRNARFLMDVFRIRSYVFSLICCSNCCINEMLPADALHTFDTGLSHQLDADDVDSDRHELWGGSTWRTVSLVCACRGEHSLVGSPWSTLLGGKHAIPKQARATSDQMGTV